MVLQLFLVEWGADLTILFVDQLIGELRLFLLLESLVPVLGVEDLLLIQGVQMVVIGKVDQIFWECICLTEQRMRAPDKTVFIEPVWSCEFDVGFFLVPKGFVEIRCVTLVAIVRGRLHGVPAILGPVALFEVLLPVVLHSHGCH